VNGRESKAGSEKEALPHLDAVYRFALRLSGAPDQAEERAPTALKARLMELLAEADA
jgi:hypothetical protein